jgi:hypothetical protein
MAEHKNLPAEINQRAKSIVDFTRCGSPQLADCSINTLCPWPD